MQCLILAGGLGTRIKLVSEDLPKSLIPVCGKPFIDHQLEWLAGQGIKSVVLATGYQASMISDLVGTGERWGLDVTCIEDGPELLGTAGSIRNAVDHNLMEDGFFVLYGDSYLNVNFSDVWKTSDGGRLPVMTVYRNEDALDRSNVIMKNRDLVLFEKGRKDACEIGMEHIDYGLSIFPREIILTHVAPHLNIDLADVCHRLSLSHELRAHEVYERFYEIGSPEGLADFEAHLSSGGNHD